MYFRRRICADSFPPLFHGGIFQEDITNIKEEKENNENLEINNLENVNGGVFADKKEEIGKNNEYLEEKNSQNITSDVPVAKNVEKENKIC